MTTARLTSRRTSLEKHKDEVIALLLTGWKPTEIAAKYKVSDPAVTKFQQRHRDKLTALREEVARQVEDYAIAHKVNRIASLDKLKTDIEDWLEDKSLTERTVRWDEDGNIIGEVERFRSDAVNALRGVLKDAGDELGQRPRPSDAVQVNVAVGVQLVWNDGEQA